MVLSEVVVMRDGGKSFEGMSRGELIEELKRLYVPESDFVTHPYEVSIHFRGMLKNENQEHFMVLFLDENKKVIDKKVVFIGTLNRSLVHPREVFHDAVINDVKKIIIGHNHPSGNIQPSVEDIEMTKKLQKAGEILGVEVVDHVIITATGHYSFHKNRRI